MFRHFFFFLILFQPLLAETPDRYEITSISEEMVPLAGKTVKIELEEGRYRDASFFTYRGYDFNDSAMDALHLFFFKLEQIHTDEWLLSEFSRTTNLSGTEGIAFLLAFQKEYALGPIHLSDGATTPGCEMDGIYCFDAPLTKIRKLNAFTSGKGFYEARGAVPNPWSGDDHPTPEQYRLAMDWIHEQLYLDDLFAETTTPDTERFYAFLKELRELYGNQRLASIYQDLASRKNESQKWHTLWHTFRDKIVANQDNPYFSLAATVLSDPDSSPELKKALTLHTLHLFFAFKEEEFYWEEQWDDKSFELSPYFLDGDFFRLRREKFIGFVSQYTDFIYELSNKSAVLFSLTASASRSSIEGAFFWSLINEEIEDASIFYPLLSLNPSEPVTPDQNPSGEALYRAIENVLKADDGQHRLLKFILAKKIIEDFDEFTFF